MTYYDLSETERKKLYRLIEKEIIQDLLAERKTVIEKYFSDPDTYIRKNCYLILGRIYKAKDSYRPKVLQVLDVLANSGNEKIRQTVVYTLGEIGKYDFDTVRNRIDFFINDIHHSVKNSLTGAIKQMGEKNPDPVFLWAKDKLKRSNADMVKRILHGLELRG